MLESIMKEVGNEVGKSVSSDLPDFAKDMEPNEVNSLDEANKPVENLDTRHKVEAGERHPDTRVLFEKKAISFDDKVVVGVFPEFPSITEVQLDESLYQASDGLQMKAATQDLAKQIETNPELEDKFTDRQLEQIEAGRPKIDGYTWHHSEEEGTMQLVDSDIHRKTGHTGGQVIWGGGSQNR